MRADRTRLRGFDLPNVNISAQRRVAGLNFAQSSKNLARARNGIAKAREIERCTGRGTWNVPTTLVQRVDSLAFFDDVRRTTAEVREGNRRVDAEVFEDRGVQVARAERVSAGNSAA